MIGLHSIPKEKRRYPDYVFTTAFGTGSEMRKALGAKDYESAYVWYCECVRCYGNTEHMFFDWEKRHYDQISADTRCYCIPCQNGNHPRREES